MFLLLALALTLNLDMGLLTSFVNPKVGASIKKLIRKANVSFARSHSDTQSGYRITRFTRDPQEGATKSTKV